MALHLSRVYTVRWERWRNREKENKRSVKIMKRNNSRKQMLYLLLLFFFPFSLSLAILMSTTVLHPTATHTVKVETRHRKHNSATTPMTRQVHTRTLFLKGIVDFLPVAFLFFPWPGASWVTGALVCLIVKNKGPCKMHPVGQKKTYCM